MQAMASSVYFGRPPVSIHPPWQRTRAAIENRSLKLYRPSRSPSPTRLQTMPPSTIDAQIRARIESFTHELAELVKRAALESVQDALNGGTPTRRTKKARGRPRATKPAKRASSRSGRRSPEQIEAMGKKILAHVKANQGHRLEEISAALKIASKELKRPVSTLMEAGKLRTEGQKRGTKYYAGGKRKKPGKKRKVAKKASRKASKKAGRKIGKKAKRNVRKKAPAPAPAKAA